MHDSLAKLEEELRFVLITSKATLAALSEAPSAINEANGITTEDQSENSVTDLSVNVSAATGTKCVRCWHIRDDIGVDSAHPELCARCVTNVTGNGEVRYYA